MGRQIKFRAWEHDKDGEGIMHTWDEIRQFDQPELTLGNWLLYPNGNRNIILQQSTGLLDKTGKEIYEGDIVKRPITMMPNKKYDIAEIQYFEDRFILKWITKCEWNDSIRAHIKDIEVIDNVYESKSNLA